jgi:PadR family transcriptional regulator, regulatory protein PadR
MNLKGSLPSLILQILSYDPSHGYDIAQRIKRQSKGVLDFKDGTLYPTLHTLERDGFVTSQEIEENGRTRRYYKITEQGIKELEQHKNSWQRLSGAITTILEGAR